MSNQDSEVIVAYKGFDANLQCRGYQYEIGKTYEHTGPVKACESGFHSSENPMDMWRYYAMGGKNRFCRVEASGEIARHNEDSKIASARITIQAEIGLPEIITNAVKWIMSTVQSSQKTMATTGDRANAATTKPHCVAASLGSCSASKAGDGGAIVCVYRDDDWNLIHIRASKVGENGIKADTFYRLDANGEFVEVES